VSAMPVLAPGDPALPGIALLDVRIRATGPPEPDRWPYVDASEARPPGDAQPETMRAVPYLAWGNRSPGGMRVWLPVQR
jgi:hypothetical protein